MQEQSAIRAGDITVLVAGPAESSMLALLRGRISKVGDCLGVDEMVVIWPHGTTLQSKDPLVIEVPRHGSYHFGDHITLGRRCK